MTQEELKCLTSLGLRDGGSDLSDKPPRCPPGRHIVLLARTADACEHACRVVGSLGEYFAGPEGRWVWCHKILDPRPKDA